MIMQTTSKFELAEAFVLQFSLIELSVSLTVNIPLLVGC